MNRTELRLNKTTKLNALGSPLSHYATKGFYYSGEVNSLALTTLAIAPRSLKAYPVAVATDIKFYEIGWEASSANTSWGCQCGIYVNNYSSNETYYPGELIVNGTYQVSANAFKNTLLPLNYTLEGGNIYWFAINCNDSTQNALRVLQGGSINPVLGRQRAGNNHFTGWAVSTTWDITQGLNTTFPRRALANPLTTNMPVVSIRVE
jgi:hypothetical protein